MKVIDLLNKIEKGEEVPRKIIVNGETYEWDTIEHYYENDNGEDLLELARRVKTKDLLNMPVIKIIEDEIDIQAIEEFRSEYTMNNVEFQIQDKLNELVQAVKQLDRKIKEKE